MPPTASGRRSSVQIKSQRFQTLTTLRAFLTDASGNGAASICPGQKTQEIGAHAGTIHERRANDRNAHSRLGVDTQQTAFGFELGASVIVLRLRRIASLEWTIDGRLAVHLDAAQEDESFDAGLGCGDRQMLRSDDIRSFELDPIRGGRIHDMNPRREVHNVVNAGKRPCPVGPPVDFTDDDRFGGKLRHRSRSQRRAQAEGSRRRRQLPSDETGRSRNEHPRDGR